MWDYERATGPLCGRDYRHKAKRFLILASDPNDSAHGTHYGYDLGCKCPRCLEAGRKHHRDLYKRKKRERKRSNGGMCSR